MRNLMVTHSCDRIFKAIADETRREIIAALADRPMPVHEVSARFAMSRPAVSRHLKVLGEAGLVRSSRRGKENLYELDRSALEDVANWLTRFWGGRLEVLKTLAERKH